MFRLLDAAAAANVNWTACFRLASAAVPRVRRSHLRERAVSTVAFARAQPQDGVLTTTTRVRSLGTPIVHAGVLAAWQKPSRWRRRWDGCKTTRREQLQRRRRQRRSGNDNERRRERRLNGENRRITKLPKGRMLCTQTRTTHTHKQTDAYTRTRAQRITHSQVCAQTTNTHTRYGRKHSTTTTTAAAITLERGVRIDNLASWIAAKALLLLTVSVC